ncbi:hypothetical protein ACLKA6_011025 [Drosophila palustris]
MDGLEAKSMRITAASLRPKTSELPSNENKFKFKIQRAAGVADADADPLPYPHFPSSGCDSAERFVSS